jgi:hypothetical protein
MTNKSPSPTTNATMEEKLQTLSMTHQQKEAPNMTNEAALLADEDDLTTDWEWEINWTADVFRHVERLEGRTLTSLPEFYEELLQFMAELEVYWMGLTRERQRETARAAREVLRKFEEMKTRVQDFARREIRKRPSFRIGRDGEIYD